MNWNILYGGGTPQWIFLQHNGPIFSPLYIPHKTPVIINNRNIVLPPLAEEYATMYARYIDTEYVQNNTFKKNFWKDFKPTIVSVVDNIILDNIDFTLIKNYLNSIKEIKQNVVLTKKMKEDIKKKQDEIEEPYKYCIIDGATQQVGNFKIEPPGIFLGRGNHPKSGHIKKRIMPEDVTINLSKDAMIPKPNIGGEWKEVIHDNSVIWLATWKEEITGKNKYIFTSLDSFFKSKSDESKFDLARQLKRKVNTIRTEYMKQLTDSNIKNKQLATALYFIDNLALRVGGSKDTKEEADTVGVTSLRIEHITLMENNMIKLDFLGKDSVRYCKKVLVDINIYNNLLLFINNKSKKEELFDTINSSSLNEYLSSFMKGLTAKVWRTYNASMLFQKELDKIKDEKVISINVNERLNFIIAMFNQANTAVALLCNHQKNVNNSNDNMIKKIDDRIKELKKKKNKYSIKTDNKDRNKRLKEKITNIDIKLKSLKLKKDTKIRMKNVSLGTSKNNYIDPRIIFSFSSRMNIDPLLLLDAKLLKRFEWAIKAGNNYRF